MHFSFFSNKETAWNLFTYWNIVNFKRDYEKIRKPTSKSTTGWRIQGLNPRRKGPEYGIKPSAPSNTKAEGSRVIPLLPFWAFMAWYRVNLTSYLFFDFFLILFLTINHLCITSTWYLWTTTLFLFLLCYFPSHSKANHMENTVTTTIKMPWVWFQTSQLRYH